MKWSRRKGKERFTSAPILYPKRIGVRKTRPTATSVSGCTVPAVDDNDVGTIRQLFNFRPRFAANHFDAFVVGEFDEF